MRGRLRVADLVVMTPSCPSVMVVTTCDIITRVTEPGEIDDESSGKGVLMGPEVTTSDGIGGGRASVSRVCVWVAPTPGAIIPVLTTTCFNGLKGGWPKSEEG